MDVRSSSTGRDRSAVRILVAIVLTELLLFGFFALRFRHSSSLDHPLTLKGEGMVIDGDGLGYYAWLRSPLIDGDWDFDNEFDQHDALGRGYSQERTPFGRANPFSVGPACLWTPAVLGTHLIYKQFAPSHARLPADGFSLPYQIAVGATALGVSFFSVLLLFGIISRYTSPRRAAICTAFVVLGTSQLNYSSIELTMGHGSGILATALLVWYWLRTYNSPSLTRWVLVGCCVGLAALMRWQLALLAILPLGETILEAERDRRTWFRSGIRLALAGLAAGVVFLPQLIAWKVVYGDWLVSPMPLARNWTEPALFRVLLSGDRSFFYWTPLTILLFLGTLVAMTQPAQKRVTDSRFPMINPKPFIVLLAAFVVQVYFLASIAGDGVFLGTSFGNRQLTESTVLLVPGLAWLIEAVSKRWRRILIGVGAALCIWNLLLMAQYHRGLVPRNAGADLVTLLKNAILLPQVWPAGVAVFLLGPALLFFVPVMRMPKLAFNWTPLRIGRIVK